jgi:hypothetical protein
MGAFSSRVTSAVAALSVAAGACAGTREPPPAPVSFPAVKTAALVRGGEGRPERPKDALDALETSLAARGIAARAVERGRGGDRALERLEDLVASRVWSGARAGGRRAPEPLGGAAAAPVRALGVDAVVLLLRFDRGLPPRDRPPTGLPPFGAPPPAGFEERPLSPYRPTAALALVSGDGALVWFDWGPRDAAYDPEGPVNAAEAVEAAARFLAGEREDG